MTARPIRRGIFLAALPTTLMLGGASCQEPTVVSVLIETDVPCDVVRRTGVTITTGPSSQSLESESPGTVAQECSNGTNTLNLVGDLTLKRGGGDTVAFRIVLGVDGQGSSETECLPPDYKGCIVARRRLRYVTHARLRVPVSLREVCKNNPCSADQTCVRGACVDAEIADPATACSSNGCDESVLRSTSGESADAGAPDGASGSDGSAADGPVPVSPPARIPKLAAGGRHACLVRESGEVWCWGSNQHGQIGRPPDGTDARIPERVSLPALAIDVTAGMDHSCALLADRTVTCWGYNVNGESGNDVALASSPPFPVGLEPGLVVVEVAAGAQHTCLRGRRPNGDLVVRCWGNAANGVLGPTSVPLIGTTHRLSAGTGLTCVLQDGVPTCWGTGPGSGFATSNNPAAHPQPSPWRAIAMGNGFSCAEVESGAGEVLCWGAAGSGQLGTVPGSGSATPVSPGFKGIGLSAKSRHGCGLYAGGTATNAVFCWGANPSAQLGPNAGGMPSSNVPVDVPLEAAPRAVAAGGEFSCALLVDGRVRCWGTNADGQLGSMPAGATDGYVALP